MKQMNAVVRAALGACGAAVVAAACASAEQSTANPSPASSDSANPAPTTDPRIEVAAGFASATIASVAGARELAALPNGDLLVGTATYSLDIVPNAEGPGAAQAPHVFVTLPDHWAQSVAVSTDHAWIYAATGHAVYRIAYHQGDQSEPSSAVQQIASVRTGSVSPGSDGDVHGTSSIAVTPTTVYVSVGSSCNSCVEVDPTRATVQAMHLDGSGMHTIARRIRNAIALAVDPATDVLWAGDAGQDSLPYGHPYEFVDAVTLQHGSPVDYGWPDCEENRHAYAPGADCSAVAQPRVEFPAYKTHIGAAFYPLQAKGAYAFPSSFAGGLFVTSHGSWHCCPSAPPEVDFVAMHGDTPAVPVNWSGPTAQFTPFLWGFGDGSSTDYIGRPTGIAVGAQGSVFVADDANGVIYRIRPTAAARRAKP